MPKQILQSSDLVGLKLFHAIYLSDAGIRKPQPEFLEVMKKHQLNPENGHGGSDFTRQMSLLPKYRDGEYLDQ